LTALEYVELDAPLESTPPIDGWVRITDLVLRNTKLRDLPTGISALASLTRLELDHNKQQINLPADIGKLASLRKLVVSGTSQAHLPSSVSRLTCLTACVITSKHSRPVSSSVLTIPNLKELTVSAGTEVSLPAGPGVLSALTLLDVTAEFISVNDQLLRQMPALRSLRMCGFAPSRHRLIYGDITPSAFLAHATALTKLVLESDFKLDPNEWRDDGSNRNPLPMNRKIFTALPALTTLRELHLTLTGANDDVLNTALAPLTNLRVLRIETKGTTWIPDVIFTLTRLEELAARRGSITHIPNQLTALQRLRVVDLYGPKGVVLSDALLMLPDLDFVNMQVDITEADSARVLRELVRRGVRVERRK
jgi:Leucine-rich repeat (LRR) protein